MIMARKKSWVRISFESGKFFGSGKNFRLKTFWVQKNVQSKIFLGPKKILDLKNIWSKKNYRSINILGQKYFRGGRGVKLWVIPH